jgi:ribosomal protein S18 acetylase RimI-like enzyme
VEEPVSNRGRFGKYGEIKRRDRLRRAGFRPLLPGGPQKGPPVKFFPRGEEEKPPGRTFLRRAVPADGAFIGGLSSRVFEVYGPYGGIVTRWFESGTSLTFAAFVGERPAGFAMIGRPSLSAPAVPVTELLAIAVEPLHQGRGLGALLLGKVEQSAIRLQVRRLLLHTASDNTRAQRLFVRCGYAAAESKPGFYPAGQDAILMFKDLG